MFLEGIQLGAPTLTNLLVPVVQERAEDTLLGVPTVLKEARVVSEIWVFLAVSGLVLPILTQLLEVCQSL